MFGIYFGSISFQELPEERYTSEGRFTSPPDVLLQEIEWLRRRGGEAGG